MYINIYDTHIQFSLVRSTHTCLMHTYVSDMSGNCGVAIGLFCRNRLFYRSLLRKSPTMLSILPTEATPYNKVAASGTTGNVFSIYLYMYIYLICISRSGNGNAAAASRFRR